VPISVICTPLEVMARVAVGITLLGSLIWLIGGSKT
jgi:hypothetical protein